MQAIFRPNGDREIVVSDQANGVMIEVYEGLDPKAYGPQCDNCADNPAKSCSNCKDGTHERPERRQTLICLSKQDARSVASAIMGAAASV